MRGALAEIWSSYRLLSSTKKWRNGETDVKYFFLDQTRTEERLRKREPAVTGTSDRYTLSDTTV